MTMLSTFLEKHYKQGNAVGGSYIQDDSLCFRYRDEVFEFPSIEVMPLVETDGTWYIAPVTKLRKLAASKK